jgi:hypothetical protein
LSQNVGSLYAAKCVNLTLAVWDVAFGFVVDEWRQVWRAWRAWQVRTCWQQEEVVDAVKDVLRLDVFL